MLAIQKNPIRVIEPENINNFSELNYAKLEENKVPTKTYHGVDREGNPTEWIGYVEDQYLKWIDPLDYSAGLEEMTDAEKTVVNDKQIEIQWSSIRSERNQLLADCDWTQLMYCPLSDEKKLEYKTYRQALRDITTQVLTELVWPIKPE